MQRVNGGDARPPITAPDPFSIPERIGRLYFRVALPMVAGSLLIAGIGASPGSLRVLVALSGTALLGAALHLLLPARWHDTLRRAFPLTTIAFVLVVALLSRPGGLSGDPLLLTVLLLLAPGTVLAWTLLFTDDARMGRLTGLGLSAAATLLVWRWQALGLQPSLSSNTPLLLLVVCLIVVSYGGAFTEINRRYLAGEQAQRRDALTGLLNRRAFDEHTRRAQAPGTALAVLDIDHFKRVNDTHGHTAGDRVLRGVADVLLDVLAGRGQAYRWGGEEFALLLPPDATEDVSAQAAALLEQVRAEVARRTFTGGQRVTLSAGLSTVQPGEAVQAAFERADSALREAKDSGRDRVVSRP
ncbi:GGDEF domain-containing protein [Deinococcus knuensis]|uniref:GGDEF domain-containing protein n=1 Tax=Deinococcus knuensis TaxID=1837380 RepID=A0ABQ2SN39_9DEIO|nr:GGDEF domain-containing protein [Deinococcus knuensis]